MTQEQFEELVRRLEGEAQERPDAYRRRVLALAALGYGYVVAILLALLAALTFLGVAFYQGHARAGVLKLGWAVGALALVVARGIAVRVPEPEGLPLARASAPRLFEVIDAVRRELGAPRIHRVLIVDDFNAAVSQVPRLGLLGWQRNYLILGVPLLHALSIDELRAVLAHEFGHLAGSDGRLGGWIYRSRMSWSRLIEEMEAREQWGHFLFRPFFRWYAPFFAAYSFVQARAQEYAADRAAARVAGAATLADALGVLAIRSRYLGERYWTRIWSWADRSAEPEGSPFRSMAESFSEGVDPTDARVWLDAALTETTGTADTHPCLAERLSALGEEPRIPPTPSHPAAELLGEVRMELESRLDRAWAEVAGSHWRERYQHVQQTSERLADLDSAAKEGPLEIDEAWERASLRAELEGDDASLPLLQEILEREPEHASARFAIGRIKLASDDEGGLEDVRVVMDVFHDAVIPGCQLVYDYLCRNGRVREAEPYRERAIAQRERLERAEAERSQLRLDGRYQTHGLEPELLFELSRRLESETRVARAWVVRRDVEEFPERPMFVLGIERVASAFEFLRPRLRRRRDLELQQALAHDLAWEPDHFVVVLNHRPSKVLGIFTAVADSQILPRSQSR